MEMTEQLDVLTCGSSASSAPSHEDSCHSGIAGRVASRLQWRHRAGIHTSFPMTASVCIPEVTPPPLF